MERLCTYLLFGVLVVNEVGVEGEGYSCAPECAPAQHMQARARAHAPHAQAAVA